MNFDPDDLNLRILYACVKYLKGRVDDAINFLLDIINKIGMKATNSNFNIILAFFFKVKKKDLLSKKHMEAAKRQKMRELGMISNTAKSKFFNNFFRKGC